MKFLKITFGCMMSIFMLPVLFLVFVLVYVNQSFDPTNAQNTLVHYYQDKGWLGTISDVSVKNREDTSGARIVNYKYLEEVDGELLTFELSNSVNTNTNAPEGVNLDLTLKDIALQHNIDIEPYRQQDVTLSSFEFVGTRVSPINYAQGLEELDKLAKQNSDKRLLGYYSLPLKELLDNKTYKIVYAYKKLVSEDDKRDTEILNEFYEQVKSLDLTKFIDGEYLFSFHKYTAIGGYSGSITDSVQVIVENGKIIKMQSGLEKSR